MYTPPAINYGMVYPPAIMIFILTLTYSVISPAILIFGAIYFGMGCEFEPELDVVEHGADLSFSSIDVVYKYKLIYGA